MTPSTEAELAEAVLGATGPLAITGGGTRPIGRTVEGVSLSTSAMTGITLYEPGALTIVAQAGTSLAEIELALAAENQRLAFEPMDHRGLLGTSGAPTIGGVVAANVSGPRRIQSGAARDFVLGVRFVDGAGTIIKNGGRVMKNVTGYDLVKLFCGSWGTLGVMSEVSLKVLPQVAAGATVTVDGLDDATAARAMAAALGSPFEVSGAAHVPESFGALAGTHLRIEGFASSVAYRSEQMKAVLGQFGPVRIEPDAEVSAALWAGLRDVAPYHGTSGDVWRLSVKPSDAPDLVARLPDAAKARAFYDWGGGLIWVECLPDTDLRAVLGPFAGHATLVRAGAPTRAAIAPFHPEPAPIAALTAGLRARFDPRGILNPGRMG
ncbi:MAG: FAD-binding protein [Flavimaricola sp.]|nr:FAD-binding protein [Flavimaricola sp.]